MAFCKSNLHLKFLFLALFLAGISTACSKKEIRNGETPPSNDTSYEEQSIEYVSGEKFEIYNPFGVNKIIFDLRDRSGYEKYSSDFRQFYFFPGVYSTNLEGTPFNDMKESSGAEIRDNDEKKGYEQGQFLNPVKLKFPSENSGAESFSISAESGSGTIKYLLMEGKIVLIENDLTETISIVSPQSVISVDSQMLASTFSPFCVLELKDNHPRRNEKLTVLERNSNSLAISRAVVHITVREKAKVVVNDIIIRSFGEKTPASSEEMYKFIADVPYKAHETYDRNKDIRMECASLYNGEQQGLLLERLLSSVFKDVGVAAEAVSDVDLMIARRKYKELESPKEQDDKEVP